MSQLDDVITELQSKRLDPHSHATEYTALVLLKTLATVAAERNELLKTLKTLRDSYLAAVEQMTLDQRIAGRMAVLDACITIAKCEANA